MLNKTKNKYHNPVILSGREGSMDSSAKAFRMTGETGRSMVEMLGVLAIIGLLSIGGIAGYKNAMNKHAANEILNEVSKRAVVGAGQLLLNKGVNLAEFENTVKKTYPIGVAGTGDWTAMQNEFAIAVQNVPEEICEKVLENALPTATDTYINGTSSKTCASGTNKITFSFANDLTKVNSANRLKACTGTKDDDSTCSNGLWQCSDGQLQCGNSCCKNGQFCSDPYGNGSCVDINKTCTADNATTVCGSASYSCCDIPSGETEGVCVPKTYTASSPSTKVCVSDAISCSSYKGCPGNTDGTNTEFCYISGASGVPKGGSCLPLSTYTVGKTVEFNGKTFIQSSKQVSWWAANDWCLAQGKHLASLSELGIDRKGKSSCYVQGITGQASMCDDISGLGSGYYSALTNATKGFGSSGYLWTSDSYNSSYAFSVALGDGNVYFSYFRNRDYYAVCSG